ncbi:MAG: transcription termination/antitermination protein NusA [Bacteroidetes bacterium]|jgi:N utilization substance protein A|nr:transcription termination/antitermination protein NusA [Bacteroidota bacterium]
MNSNDLIESFSDFKEFKNVDRVTMMRILEEVFRGILKKNHGDDANFDIIINAEKGDLEIWRNREIVPDEELEDSNTQITLTKARQVDEDFEVGEDFSEEVPLETFGRRAVITARQTLIGKLLELQKEDVIKKYKDRLGEIVIGEVYQVWKKEILVLDDDGNELIMPKTEQIPTDFFKKGDGIRAVVLRVDIKNNNPQIILSRTAPEFLERLFELEVPEIADGLISIRHIVREPGERAKVAVESFDDRIDPVGACVGMKGSRIHGIVRELRNENIDVINYTNNTALYISRSLSPAKISTIKIDEDKNRVSVYLRPDQVSLAIGKGGLNIKLAAKLTGYEIDVFRENEKEEEFDIDLDEFTDEIDNWVIDELKAIGLDTAKSVLTLTTEELVRRTELEEETIKEVVKILKSEFE